MPGATRTIIINATPSTLYNVIVDYPAYASFLAEVESATVTSREGNTTTATFTVDLKVKRISYTLQLQENLNQSVTWSLVTGEFMTVNNGSWYLNDLGDGRTEVTYSVEVVPQVPRLLSRLKNTISKKLTEQSLPRTLEAFKQRAESLS